MHIRRAASLALLAVLLAGCTRAGRQMNNRGNTAYERQDFSQALTDYRQAAEKLPQAAEPAYNAGNALYRQEDYAGSLQEMQQALQRAGGELSQHAYFNLGNTLFQGQQLDLAAEAFTEALRLDPGDLDAKHNLELALQKQQEQQEQKDQQKQDQDKQGGQSGQNGEQTDQQARTPTPQGPEQGGAPTPEATPTGDAGAEQGSQAKPEATELSPQAAETQQAQGLTEEQARQLLQAAADNAQTLQEYMQQLIVPENPPEKDW